MAVGTLFGDIGMFVDKRPLILHMAAGAEGFACDALEVVTVGRAMWIMAVGTGHLVFRNRMMGKLGKLHFSLRVAASAELFLLMTANFLLRPFVQFVAVKAAYIVQCVYA